MKLYELHLFKKSTRFNGDSWSSIDKGILFISHSNLKCLSLQNVYVYKNLFGNCNGFALLQKMFEFFMIYCNSPVIICNSVCLFMWCSFSSLKLLIGFLSSASFSGDLKIFYGSILVSSLRLEKIKYRSYLGARSDFTVKRRRMIIYTDI